MSQLDVFTGVNNAFLIRLFAMLDDRFDERARVCTSKNQAQFTNITMHDIRTLLLQLICIDRQRIDVAMLNQKLCSLTAFGVVELTIGIHAFVTVLQQRVAEDFIRIRMLMIPNQRNLLTVICLECIFSDNPSVRAFQVITCSPTAKIVIFHFDVIPPLLNFVSISS